MNNDERIMMHENINSNSSSDSNENLNENFDFNEEDFNEIKEIRKWIVSCRIPHVHPDIY